MKAVFLIVTPSYNQAKYLRQTLRSVIKQRCPHIMVEYLVMDGGSKDQSVAILEQHQDLLKFVSQPDGGQSDAINQGIARLQQLKPDHKHTFFAYINSDDYYLPNSFAKVVQEFARQPSSQWLVGDAQIVNQSGQAVQGVVRLYKQLLRKVLSWWPGLLFVCNPIPQPAVFIRWSAVQQCGVFNQNLHYVMDYEYWLRCWRKLGSPILCSTPLAAFRVHPSSKGGSEFKQQFAEELAVARQFTQNRVLLWLHQRHVQLIVWLYTKMKK